MTLITIVLCIIFIIGGIYYYLYFSILYGKPKSAPSLANIHLAHGKIKVVCAGDSNTHGNVSSDWVAYLQGKHPNYFFFNAGINADLTFTLKRRWDDIIALQPDFVTILIGTNDINATSGEDELKTYRDMGKLEKWEHPDIVHFKDNLNFLVGRLKKETTARIALMSLPLITEDLNTLSNQKVDKYSKLIQEVAEDNEVTYLPLHEKQKNYLLSHSSNTNVSNASKNILLYKSVVYHYLLKKDWNYISQKNGFQLLTDTIHQNDIAGKMIADLVEGWLHEHI